MLGKKQDGDDAESGTVIYDKGAAGAGASRSLHTASFLYKISRAADVDWFLHVCKIEHAAYRRSVKTGTSPVGLGC